MRPEGTLPRDAHPSMAAQQLRFAPAFFLLHFFVKGGFMKIKASKHLLELEGCSVAIPRRGFYGARPIR
ncbi:MAG: hypothetical protein M1272_06490 [Firmicutes bacterium]|nr:hypothetical protein [Bacillota bacterium]